MKIPKVVGSSQKASGQMYGQTVPMMRHPLRTISYGTAIPNATPKRPGDRPAPGNLLGYARRDYQPKKKI